MKFHKKPVVIEAEQYDLDSADPPGLCRCTMVREQRPHVHTIHRNQLVVVEHGDWILPEPDGQSFYPVKPDIFEATYEAVEDDSDA